MTAHRRQLLALLTALAVVLTACGGDGDSAESGSPEAPAEDSGVRENEEEPAEEGSPQYGGAVSIGLEAETNSWLPGESQPANAGYVVYSAIYDPLVARVEDGSIQPYLASSVTPNADFTRWSVTLREGVTFHDGTALDANVMKRIFDEFLKAEGANTAGGLQDTQMEVTGPMSFDYVLAEGDAAWLDNLLGTIGYPFSPDAAAAAGDDAGARPVGTGPFVFQSWTRDDQLVVVRNDSYWGTDADGNQLPYLDQITFRPIPDEKTRLDSVASGDIDVMQTLRQSVVRDARGLVDGGGFRSYEWLGNNAGAGIINTMKPPFDDKRVRQALVYAVDQQQMIEVLGGTGITPPQTQWFSEDSPWYSEAAAAAWIEYDPATAEALLEEYVNDPERSDGAPVGTPVNFTYDCPPDPSLVELSQAYQAFWQQVGFVVDLDSKEQTAHITQGIGTENDPFLRGDYEVQCWRLGSEADPYTTWSSAFGPVDTEILNVSDYTHPTIDRNLDEMRLEGDVEVRKELVEDISLLLAEEVPNFWTGSTATAIVARDAVRGVLRPTTPEGSEIDGAASAVIRTPFLWLAQ